MNGDLRIAYRASRDGPRDIVYVPYWATSCEVFPELPSLQGWIEAMTSLGRLSSSTSRGREPPILSRRMRYRHWSSGPTASPQCSTISAALKRSSSRAPALSQRRRYSPQHIRPAPRRLSRWGARGRSQRPIEETHAPVAAMWGTGELHIDQSGHAVERRDPDDLGSKGTPSSEPTPLLYAASIAELDVRAVLPTVRVPTLVVHHTDGGIIPPAKGKYIAEHISGANTSNCQAATGTTSWNHGARLSGRSPSSSPATSRRWPTIWFWPRCCSPTSWTRRAGRRNG